MSRTIKEYRYTMLPPHFQSQVEQYLASEGYKPYFDKGVQVYKYGVGALTGPKFFQITYLPNIIRIEGWIKFAVVPGVYCGESELSGFYGSIPKAGAKKVLDQLERMLLSVGAVPILPAPYAQQPQQPYQQPQQPYQQPQQPQQPYQQPQQNQAVNYIFCSKCGARVTADSAFCSACGNRIQ